jgi:hypothetical protein
VPSLALVRIFVAGDADDDVSELTPGGSPVVRFAAPDLQRAQRDGARIRADGREVAAILDVAVAVPGDYRSDGHDPTVRYAGTVDGLAGLIADIERAGVADGVTLIPAAGLPRQDLRRLGHDVLARLAAGERSSA